jgi:hypothetical protein
MFQSERLKIKRFARKNNAFSLLKTKTGRAADGHVPQKSVLPAALTAVFA